MSLPFLIKILLFVFFLFVCLCLCCLFVRIFVSLLIACLALVYADDNSFVQKNTTVVVKRKAVPSGTVGLLARLQGATASPAGGWRAAP
jgi:hypothetical protein